MTRPPHILVVDDDREIRTLLRDFLEKNGFAATAVADGQETRRALTRERYDLVVLDLMLPRESGLEICRELRATSDLLVIILLWSVSGATATAGGPRARPRDDGRRPSGFQHAWNDALRSPR